MGRIETSSETLTVDAPPPIEHEPPPTIIPPPAAEVEEPPHHYPQQFPPPQHPLVHQFPPPQHPHHVVQQFPLPPQDPHHVVHQFPPPPQDPHHVVHQFPPPPQDPHLVVHQFPPPQQQAAAYHFTATTPNQYQQQPTNGIPLGILPTQPWTSNLFDCMNNPQNAVITLFLPCVTFGQIAEIVDAGSTSCGTSGILYSVIACCIAMPCIMSCTYRTKLRSKYGLDESPAPDWVIHCFCEYCALCQEYRELEKRGFDPTIGWLGNVAKQQQNQQQFGMTPPMQQRMS